MSFLFVRDVVDDGQSRHAPSISDDEPLTIADADSTTTPHTTIYSPTSPTPNAEDSRSMSPATIDVTMKNAEHEDNTPKLYESLLPLTITDDVGFLSNLYQLIYLGPNF